VGEGEHSGGSVQVATPPRSLGDSLEEEQGEVEVRVDEALDRSELVAGKRRFTLAALVAMAITAVPFIWLLWSDWGPANPLRLSNYQDNFYDLQTRAMFEGHLSLANGALGLEGFVHDGRTYTYFGLFPSIIRMPVLLVTHSLDGKLTAPYMLLAWLLTGLFSSLLLWRVRFLVRGDSVMGKTEATGFGVLLAAIMGGTIWMLLASTPFVFNEDIAWSICLTVASIFALLGVIERPCWGRIIASGVLILCANLNRSTTGWACVVGAGLIALWLLLGRGGQENRRWFLPVLLVAGLIPLVIGCIVNYAKFGVYFGVSNREQVWTQVNAYRRKFLAANHGAEEGTVFVPTNVVTYFRPNGLGLSRVFPFITLPSTPPTAVHGVLFDRLYRTASLPVSSPLLFLLSIWGLVTAFRPRAIGRVAKTRLLLIASGSAGAALMLWGYIAPRYMGDFVPFLVLASAVAAADIFRRLEGRKRSVRLGSLAVIAVVALFSIWANVGMAIVPNEEWDVTQALNYVQAQKDISDLTGHPLEANVVRGNSLPAWAPAGQLYVVRDCSGFYISNGENYSTVPSQQYTRTTWMTVELGQAFQHAFRLGVGTPTAGGTQSFPLLTAGKTTVTMAVTPTASSHVVLLGFDIYDGTDMVKGPVFVAHSGTTHTVLVTTDPMKHQFSADFDGVSHLITAWTSGAPVHVAAAVHAGDASSALSLRAIPTPQPTLCQSLNR
jgi:hypothetical protein